MADQAARNLQYEYKANSNLVLQADLRYFKTFSALFPVFWISILFTRVPVLEITILSSMPLYLDKYPYSECGSGCSTGRPLNTDPDPKHCLFQVLVVKNSLYISRNTAGT